MKLQAVADKGHVKKSNSRSEESLQPLIQVITSVVKASIASVVAVGFKSYQGFQTVYIPVATLPDAYRYEADADWLAHCQYDVTEWDKFDWQCYLSDIFHQIVSADQSLRSTLLDAVTLSSQGNKLRFRPFVELHFMTDVTSCTVSASEQVSAMADCWSQSRLVNLDFYMSLMMKETKSFISVRIYRWAMPLLLKAELTCCIWLTHCNIACLQHSGK